MEAKMQNGSSKTGRRVTVNGTVSTLKRQPRTASGRQERGYCSSTASCPMFSGCQSDLDEAWMNPSSLSSPTLHKPGSTSNLKGSVSSLQGSLSSLKGSVTSLKSFPTPSTLQSSGPSLRSSSPSLRSSSPSLRSSSPSLRSSSPSLRSSSPSLRSSSEDDSWDTNSWSSGATCLLRSSIKQHSEEVFRVRAGSASRPEGTSDSETGYQNSDSCQGSVMGSESQEGAEQDKDSSSSQGTSAASMPSSNLEQKIEEKLKFSQFLDEVTCRVLNPECLQAFGTPIRQKEPQTLSLPCLNPTPVSSPWFGSSACDSRDSNVYKWAKCMPSCKILDASETLRRTQEEMEMLGRTYLETDIDRVRREDEESSTLSRDVEKRTLQLSGESSHRCPSPVSKRSDGAPRPPYRTTSLPRPAVSADMVSDGDASSSSWLQEEDLRRRLGCSTHRLQQLQNEFQSTRQYLETELRRAQEKLDKFTEKLSRIQSSYAALQRINHDTEEKIHRMTQRHEEEKRSLSREIGTLKNHLMEAKITIQKLREDNDLYRKDCNLAAQLLQCGKSPYGAHKLSELPADLQKRVSFHMERQGRGRSAALRHSYSDAVPTAVIGRVLEKPEPGRSCPVTRSPSPQAPEFPDKVQRHTAYKSSDLYFSDTALYCPTDEQRCNRWPEGRQSVDQSGGIRGHTSTDGNLDDESFPLHEDPLRGFVLGSLPASSHYSSCSTVSDEKLHGSSLCTDWRDGDYERKNLSSYGKEHPGFPKSSSFQHVGSQNDRSGDRRILIPADPTDGWRQMSMEDVSRFSPFGFSEHHFKIKPSPLYGSYQDGDNVFHRRVPDPGFPASAGSSPALNPKRSLNAMKAERGLMLRSKDSTSSFFITGNAKDKENTTKQRDFADESPGSSMESLNQALDVQKYKDLQNPGAQKMTPRHQKFGNAGLSRKDSLNKAQLYGTLLN